MKGKVHTVCIPSTYLMGGEGRFNIYLPQGAESGRKFPVLYLFHGVIDNNTSWTCKGRAVEQLEKAVADGKASPFIIVMPRAWNSFYVDGMGLFDGRPGHNYRSFFTKELVPYIEANYPVLTGRSNTAIAGDSMGGYGAMLYAVLEPQRYCMCYAMSGALMGLNWTRLTTKVPSIPDVIASVAKAGSADGGSLDLPELYIDCGRWDPVCGRMNTKAHRRLMAMGVPHHYSRHSGSHLWRYWRGCFGRLLSVLFVQKRD